MPSSVIDSFAYDADSAALDVTFVAGRRYRYFMVPAYVARDLAEAQSQGRYFNTRIRDRFPCEELAGKARKAAVTSPRTGNRRRP